jgi:hypothetical protein
VATIDSVPAAARVHVLQDFGEHYRSGNVDVAQEGVTFLAVTLRPARQQPTVALLPLSIPPISVNADRSELTLEVTLVASSSASFTPSSYGESLPTLVLALGQSYEQGSTLQCLDWLDRERAVTSCNPLAASPYAVSVVRFDYDAVGTVPLLAQQGPARSAMLLMDQSGRVAERDPGAKRSFAARAFIARTISSPEPKSLSVAGFAADGGDAGARAFLPERPLWVPLGAGSVFTTDRAVLQAAVGLLEPLVSGSAPVFDALQAAFALTVAEAPPGNRAVVALLAGGDDRDMSEAARKAALASLRRQRDDAGIQSVLIAGAALAQRGERAALAELSAALRAPMISLGVRPPGFRGSTWEAGSYAALDLAADLIDGAPLPTLSAVFNVRAHEPGAFPAGATLRGALHIESDLCPMGCWEIPLEFAVEIPE